MAEKYDSLFANPGTSDTDFLALLQEMSPEELAAMFEPYSQEQNVLDQRMALAGQFRQPGPQHSSPMGALLGGLSNAVGNVGGAILEQRGLNAQTALGKHMQNDATGRTQALIRLLRNRGQSPGGMSGDTVDPALLVSPTGY